MQFTDLPVDFKVTMIGFTGFLQLPTQRWGIRLNIDSGALSGFVGRGVTATPYNTGNWRWWDLSAGLPLMFGPVQTVIFLGYGNGRFYTETPGATFTRQETTGFVLGADVWVPIGQQFYFAGSATFGPSQNYRYFNGPPDFLRAEGRASAGVYSAGIGYMFPNTMASVELGYRTGSFGTSSISSGDLAVDGQNAWWSGVYLGLTIRR